MACWFSLVAHLRGGSPTPTHLKPALAQYQAQTLAWYNGICDTGFGSLTGDDILDMSDQIRSIIDWSDKERMDIWDQDSLAFKTHDGLRYLHPHLRSEEVRFIPFLFHLARPIALHRLMGYSQDLVSLLSMRALWLGSQGIVEFNRGLCVLPPPGYDGGDDTSLIIRNDLIEMLAHSVAYRLYERSVTEDEHAATIRLFWKDLDDEPNFYLTDDLGERTRLFNHALGKSPIPNCVVQH